MTLPYRTDDDTLIGAKLKLSNDVQSDDGIANMAICEAAIRLRELVTAIHAVVNENPHLCDGEICTLRPLVVEIERGKKKRH